MSKIADKILERVKPNQKSNSISDSDLMMIAQELVSALVDDNGSGVADALRAAFACMSSEKTRNYADGGMVDEKDEDVFDQKLKAIEKFAEETGSYMGQHPGEDIYETVDEDLLDVVLGDPRKYVEVASNPEAYEKFSKAYREAFDKTGSKEEIDSKPFRDMLYSPEFWRSLKTQSFNDEKAYKAAELRLAQANQKQLTLEQQASADAEKAITEGNKPKLVELRDPRSNLTVLTDKPAKALRKNPALKAAPKKPAAKPALPRTIQMGPLR